MNPKTTYAIAEFSSCGGASESSHGARPHDANATNSMERSVALPDVGNSQTKQLQEGTIANCPDSCVCDGDGDSESITG